MWGAAFSCLRFKLADIVLICHFMAIFRLQVTGTGLTTASSTALTGTRLASTDITVKLLTLRVADPKDWLSELAKLTPATVPTTSWEELNDRSYVHLSAAGNNDAKVRHFPAQFPPF